tara:strand:- start:1139 stop:1897 length:759 start_codon:yes stop_codon:yes gene_type:complete
VHNNQTLWGIHTVSEAIRAGRKVTRIVIARGIKNPKIHEIVEKARTEGILVEFEPRRVLDQLTHDSTHQGIVATVEAMTYRRLEEFLSGFSDPGLLVVLDGIEDPHNLGAIIRSSYAAGVDALVVSERRSAPLSETAAKAAAGALEYLPIIRVKNINRSLVAIKKAGFWVFGLDERGSQNYDRVDFLTSTAFVLGAEGKGLRQLTAKHCDSLIRIPLIGHISSLNVSVSAGVVLFEAAKQRRHSHQRISKKR